MVNYSLNFIFGDEQRKHNFDRILTLEELKETVSRIFIEIDPNTILLKYFDEDNDAVTISTKDEVVEFYNVLKLQPNKELIVTIFGEIKEKDVQIEEKEEEEKGEEKEEEICHHIGCDFCARQIVGIRWKCANCRVNKKKRYSKTLEIIN